MTTSKTLLVTTCIALASALPGCQAQSPAHGEIGSVLPLRVGIYVDESQTCADPANAGILSYNGEGLSGAHDHDCHLIVDSHQGKRFAYSQQCVGTGMGEGPVTHEKGFMIIESDKRFVLQRQAGKTVFNYCDPAALPAGIPAPAPYSLPRPETGAKAPADGVFEPR
jgi:hypothetical protein